MHAFRRSHSLYRLVLAWFMASLLIATASPIVHPQAIELVCSSAGAVKAIVQGEDGPVELGATAMDCPLCLISVPLPVTAQIALPTPQPLGRALQSIPAARIAAATASPLPARGPPTLS
jgi:hypothetical protein